MKVARHWARETVSFPHGRKIGEVGCWGWSEDSRAEAQQRSREAGGRLAEWLQTIAGGIDAELHGFQGWYGYESRPAREEIVDQFHDSSGDLMAAITRNRYGCLVLNTRDLVFVDADVPRPKRAGLAGVPKFLKRLLGMAADHESDAASPEQAVLDRIRAWSATHPDIGLRLYRTAAGLRGVVTSRAIDARHADADALLGELGSDPLYRQLCKSQECYRARLTPKPWRIGFRAPPNVFPWPDAVAESQFREWQRAYERAAEDYSTCRFVEQLGAEEIAAELEPLLELHDRRTRCNGKGQLA